MPRHIPTTSPLYEEARRLRREQGLSVLKIAAQLSLGEKTITRWVKDIELTPEQISAMYIDRAHKGAATVRKDNSREEACRMRCEQGMSVKQIAAALKVSQSSVSTWVRHIQLTDAQVATLEERRQNNLQHNRTKASKTNVSKFRSYREQYQNEGRLKAQERDPLHVAGCMLYWAEGAKSRHTMKFVNSDPEMVIFFGRFLREALNVPIEDINIRIACYLNNGLTLEEIETYWLKLLELPISCLRKATVNIQPISSKQKGRKLLYGLCVISVYNVRVLHHIYGAIQEYIGIDKPEWLE